MSKHNCSSLLVGALFLAIACPLSAQDDARSRHRTGATVTTRKGQPRPDLFVGPDLVVVSLQSANSYGRELDFETGESVSAYSVGTTLCNQGDLPAVWIPFSNQHPVMSRTLYRLREGRFEQIGLSWLEHGFFAVNDDACGTCIEPGGVSGRSLGAGCSDPTGANIAGLQHSLSRRSDVNAFTGYFPYPFNRSPKDDKIDRRLQVRTADLDPELNSGALYFAEGQYVTPDEAAWGNHFNNASYRPAVVYKAAPGNGYCLNPASVTDGDFCLQVTSSTRVAQPAIRAWKQHDPGVVETDVFIPNEGYMILAAKATNLRDGYWNYEYALYNMNSHRSAGSFAVPIDNGTMIDSFGFHAPRYHSGEPYDNAAWDSVVKDGAIEWRTAPFEANPDANALRWGTLYNFRFVADQPPTDVLVEIGLFRPGDPDSVLVETIGPGIGRFPTGR